MQRSGIDKRAVAKMMQGIQREFDKHPIRVPVEVEDPELPVGTSFGTSIYNGPVIQGDANRAGRFLVRSTAKTSSFSAISPR
jgi:hypothetical protein